MAYAISSHILWGTLIGLSPSLIWLVFWRQLVRKGHEHVRLIFVCFMLGAGAVLVATLFQKAFSYVVIVPTHRIVVWAAIEELLKFLVFYIVAYKTEKNPDALDAPMYLIAVALGFAALENIFYILKPGWSFNVTASLLTGGLRFFGSTLLHAIASSFVGIVITLTPKIVRGLGMVLGIIGAIFLHSTFNFFILKNDTASFLQIYGYLWIVAIISHIILEKFRRFPSEAVQTV